MRDAMRACFEAVTTVPARILGLEGYGLDVGCNADPVLLQAGIRSRRSACAPRGCSWSGAAGLSPKARRSQLTVEGRPAVVDASSYAPPE